MARAAAAEPETLPVEVEAVTSAAPVMDFIVLWAGLSVHIDGQDVPLTLVQGDRVPAEAVDQAMRFVSLGAVAAIKRA